MARKTVFLDMDGVIADFAGGAFKAHGRPNPYEEAENRGEFHFDKIWRVSDEEFWAPINARGAGFWANLEKTKEADQIVAALTEWVGIDNICILSAPSADPRCIPGKLEFLAREFPQIKHTMFGSAKHLLAGPDKWLVDDKDLNVNGFRNNGGSAILVPRPWNSLHCSNIDVMMHLGLYIGIDTMAKVC